MAFCCARQAPRDADGMNEPPPSLVCSAIVTFPGLLCVWLCDSGDEGATMRVRAAAAVWRPGRQAGRRLRRIEGRRLWVGSWGVRCRVSEVEACLMSERAS